MLDNISVDGLERYMVVLENGQNYLFWASSVEHAKEQAEDAEPDNPISKVHKLILVWDREYEND